MNKKAKRTTAGAFEIVEYNLNVLYHLPKKYKNLERVLRDVLKDLRVILRFCKRVEPILFKQKYIWYLDNGRLTGLRGTSTFPVSNRHFNFLCCIGAIRKIKQVEGYMTEVSSQILSSKAQNGRTGERLPNNFTVYRYTPKQLEQMEKRASELLQHKITAGNISKDKLVAAGCTTLAKEVFWSNKDSSYEKKEAEFTMLLGHIEALINNKGYTMKTEICHNLKWSRDKLDKLLTVFKEKWLQLYVYKSPNKAEKKLYDLDSSAWIIKRR